MGKLPKVTIAIPTYRRDQVLCNTIRQMLEQDYDDYEIIVVDQLPNHDPDTIQFLNSVQDRIRYFVLDKANLPYARNVCIREAKSEIIIFIDDDVKIDKHFVRHHVKNYENPEVMAVVGKVIEPGKKRLPHIKPERFVFFGRPYFNSTSDIKAFVKGGKGGNVSYRKIVFENVGMFDEHFSGSSIREDTDMFLRIVRKGYKIVYDPMAVIYHLHVPYGGTTYFKAYDKKRRVRNPSHSPDVIASEVLFQLKHYNFLSLSPLLPFLFVNYALVKNFPDIGGIMKSIIAIIKGFVMGIDKYRRIRF